MNAVEMLTKAAETIAQRGKQNGYDNQQERSARDIALLMSQKKGRHFSEEDIWDMLIFLKEVRLERQLKNGSDPTDTLIDLIGYHALKAECISETKP